MPETVTFRFCPVCGAPYDQAFWDRDQKDCRACGFTYYENQHATVGAVIRRGDKVLLVERAVNPSKGTWDLPGGFVEPQETGEAAVIREVQEELGVPVRVLSLLGTFGPTRYEFQGRVQYNTDLYYLVEPLSDDFQPADDVASYRWFALDQLPPPEQIGFPSVLKVLAAVAPVSATK